MIVYGHRGAKGEAPENTLPGFIHAYRHGIRHFELDLVLSKEGVPVLVHDLTVDRTTSSKGGVRKFTTEELADMDARRNTSSWPTKTGIPTLESLLDLFSDLEHLQLEVKKDNRQRLNILCNRLTEIIQRRHLYRQAAVTSADPWFLKEIRRRDRNIRIGLVAERRFPNPLNTAIRLGCEYFCVNWKIVSPEMVETAHRRNMHVSTWTVNRIHDMLQLEAMGVDSIITDYPTSSRMFFDNRARALLNLPMQGRENPSGLEPDSARA
ncbi:glycerophosphodiester phosphodiesterase [Marinobacter lutaoensis]|jgi:glycerophosphoryl diester phosphodiesterase|uniref:Glycerophosphodiester phosphodiesterase n=1 Tax=Marinobacter lutaoensis TaxID=135739 RepID=A0A1V2DWS0_9GAMM|nr:glycerophosphodiester phosphodiesterase [Marinobacter lutaoensis]MBE02920.1 glycerophosphodiester phosphodiesterase [Marinobacter sp.]NVD34397.1 glycerophosphodiester phosphodiesterase [Marinobacter lutaoensis]ONF45195.1 glycerophosphodiester phosphodiesterase [Marinobacter lutaoensis]|tara:strand:+ start:2778 stop:3575 length:798 start_codon:yes stop_codon:yes gene_type:complete